MTDERASQDHRETARPSWLHEPCPSWCTREHQEDDHPEDRLHQDDGTVIAAIVGDVDPVTLAIRPRSTELVVQRVRATAGRAPDWVTIVDTEHSPTRLILSEDGALALHRHLPGFDR